MGDCTVIEPYERNALYRADSSSIRFQIRTEGNGPEIKLISRQDPSMHLYKIILGYVTKVTNLHEEKEEKFSTRSLASFQEFQEIWLAWFNNKIQMGVVGENEPCFVYNILTNSEHKIGFVQFKTVCRHWAAVEWIVETSPVILKPVSHKKFQERPQWLPMTDGKLPPDAMIGGFENELTYIARSLHNNSLCPGKYVPSTGLAYVPWGHREHSKQQFEILCGFNGQWIKTRSNYIPPNAFIGGHSEVQNDPLYIGRAMLQGRLICGKVHVRYNLCYLPLNGKEIEVSAYEILVIPENEILQAL